MVERNKRKVRLGKVISDRMDKSIVVAVERLVRHPRYDRVVRRTSTLTAHDETNECQRGDTVRVMETRPLSKRKRWRVVEVVQRGQGAL